MADPITGALVSGGIKLLSGLFGRKKTTTSRVDYKQMVADALAAGFNPMSVLRNGGTTGYTNVSAPTLSTGEFLADALGAGYQAFMDIDADNRQAEFDQVQMDLMRQEIETSQASAEAFRNRSWGATIPQAVTYGGSNVSSSARFDGGGNVHYDPTRTSVVVRGEQLSPDPNFSDAEAIEQRYGDPFSWAYGVGTAVADAVHTFGPEGPMPDPPTFSWEDRPRSPMVDEMNGRAQANRWVREGAGSYRYPWSPEYQSPVF